MILYVVHYGELTIKGLNRSKFENKLIEDISSRIKPLGDVSIKKRFGKLLIISSVDISSVISKIPGISYFAIAKISNLTIEDIISTSQSYIDDSFTSFKIETKRSNKLFQYNSPEISKIVGGNIFMNYSKKVDLHNPEKIINIEIGEKEAILYSDKIFGLGGLPKGTTGKVIGLLSGGIDSPIAIYQTIKRGVNIVLMHAFNTNINPEKVRDKIYKLTEIIGKYYGDIKLIMLPYQLMLREIAINVPSEYRMILFKRSILRVANLIAVKEKAKAIINGDSIGQVASQTIQNINSVNSASNIPVLSPLISYNKQEIIDIAKLIGTYKVSILPYDDCCTIISGTSPKTLSKLKNILKYESKIDYSKIEKHILDDSFEKVFKFCI